METSNAKALGIDLYDCPSQTTALENWFRRTSLSNVKLTTPLFLCVPLLRLATQLRALDASASIPWGCGRNHQSSDFPCTQTLNRFPGVGVNMVPIYESDDLCLLWHDRRTADWLAMRMPWTANEDMHHFKTTTLSPPCQLLPLHCHNDCVMHSAKVFEETTFQNECATLAKPVRKEQLVLHYKMPHDIAGTAYEVWRKMEESELAPSAVFTSAASPS